MSEYPDLLPCPFCGSKNISEGESMSNEGGFTHKQTGCLDCGALGGNALCEDIFDDTPCNKAWNTRDESKLKGLQLDYDLLKISFDQKNVILNSCETALSERYTKLKSLEEKLTIARYILDYYATVMKDKEAQEALEKIK